MLPNGWNQSLGVGRNGQVNKAQPSPLSCSSNGVLVHRIQRHTNREKCVAIARFRDMNINVWTALDKICHDEVVEISKRMAKKVLTSSHASCPLSLDCGLLIDLPPALRRETLKDHRSLDLRNNQAMFFGCLGPQISKKLRSHRRHIRSRVW